MKFPMTFTDEHGETHFGEMDIPDQVVPFGPPPTPMGQLNDFGSVSKMFVFSVPAGTEAPAHNAPEPYIAICLSGEGEVETSDGAKLRLRAGDLLFCNDLSGKGHATRAITDLVAAFINRSTS